MYLVEDLGETPDDGAAHVEARLEVATQAVLQQLREPRVALLPPRPPVLELGRDRYQRVVRVPCARRETHAHGCKRSARVHARSEMGGAAQQRFMRCYFFF